MFIDTCRLFDGVPRECAVELLEKYHAKRKRFARGEVVFHEDEIITDIAIVESGCLEGIRYLVDGERDVAAVFTEGDVFGDVLAVSSGRRAPVTVSARCDSSVCFVPFEDILRGDNEAGITVLKNLMKCISEKYFDLNFRLMCLACPTLRRKILFYLGSLSSHGNEAFNIPLDREALADFLCTDRSALSRELSKMKREGIIDFYKNTFKLLPKKERGSLS